MNKYCRYKKRYHWISRIIRKHVTNRSHAPRLRASKRVYDSKMFTFSSMLNAEKEYASYMMNMANYPQWVTRRYQLTTGTGPITYEATISL